MKFTSRIYGYIPPANTKPGPGPESASNGAAQERAVDGCRDLVGASPELLGQLARVARIAARKHQHGKLLGPRSVLRVAL